MERWEADIFLWSLHIDNIWQLEAEARNIDTGN